MSGPPNRDPAPLGEQFNHCRYGEHTTDSACVYIAGDASDGSLDSMRAFEFAIQNYTSSRSITRQVAVILHCLTYVECISCIVVPSSVDDRYSRTSPCCGSSRDEMDSRR